MYFQYDPKADTAATPRCLGRVKREQQKYTTPPTGHKKKYNIYVFNLLCLSVCWYLPVVLMMMVVVVI